MAYVIPHTCFAYVTLKPFYHCLSNVFDKSFHFIISTMDSQNIFYGYPFFGASFILLIHDNLVLYTTSNLKNMLLLFGVKVVETTVFLKHHFLGILVCLPKCHLRNITLCSWFLLFSLDITFASPIYFIIFDHKIDQKPK